MRPRILVVLALALATPVPAHAFDDIVRGVVVSGSFETASAGDAILGELGGAWGGLRAFPDRRWIMQWEVLATLKAGVLGSEHPYLFLIGPHGSSWIEADRRFGLAKTTFYLGARLLGDAENLGNPDVKSFATINSVDGVGGIVARGTARIAAGASYLDTKHSLLAGLFVQEELDAPEINTPAYAFSELGLSARFDVARSFMASVDGLCGITPAQGDAVRNATESTMRCSIAAAFRKIFANGVWIGATLMYERDTEHLVYAGGGAYDTASAPTFAAALAFGVPLWKVR
jgi:hypothetical protein